MGDALDVLSLETCIVNLEQSILNGFYNSAVYRYTSQIIGFMGFRFSNDRTVATVFLLSRESEMTVGRILEVKAESLAGHIKFFSAGKHGVVLEVVSLG